ncbi:MAG: phosphatidate cytidylyltransferase [Clostridia bacterium]
MSGVMCAIVVLLILFVDVPIIDTVVVTAISLIGIYEYNKAFKKAGYHPISWIGYLGCFAIFLMGGILNNADKMVLFRIAMPAVVIMIFMYIILRNLKTSVMDVMITGFSLMYIPFMFSFVKLILLMPHGRFLIWFVLMGAFASDVFAYVIGSKFGKRKLCPDISPKKTVEGSIAGIIGVIISYIILAVVANNMLAMNLNILIIVFAGFITAIVGQFGDLSASAIKRFCNIKDFGTIMPGHGGILDRFDSILFVAPVVYMLLKVYLGF